MVVKTKNPTHGGILQINDKPDSVLPQASRFQPSRGSEHNQSAYYVAMICQALYPFPCLGRTVGNLFEVAAHRDCPFHPMFFNRFVTVALIVGSPRPVISRYAVPCSPDFPPYPQF